MFDFGESETDSQRSSLRKIKDKEEPKKASIATKTAVQRSSIKKKKQPPMSANTEVDTEGTSAGPNSLKTI